MNAFVLSYCARLAHLGQACRVVQVPIETIGRHYQAMSRLQPDTDHTKMQHGAKELLAVACQARASDIHIRVRKASTEIHFRVHNDLVPMSGQTREYGERLLATLYGAMTSVSDSSYKPSERQDASIADRDKLPPGLYRRAHCHRADQRRHADGAAPAVQRRRRQRRPASARLQRRTRGRAAAAERAAPSA
jgi:general secretion pathway protein E